MSELTGASQETLAIIAHVKAALPPEHRVVTNERDYGWVIGIGCMPLMRSAILQDHGYQMSVASAPDLVRYLSDESVTRPPNRQGVAFDPSADEPGLILTVTFRRDSPQNRIELSAPIADDLIDPMRRMISRWAEEWRAMNSLPD